MLTFAFVGWQLERASVAQVERLVDVEDGLYPVVAGGDVVEALRGISEGSGVDDGGRARRERVNINAEGLLRLGSHETDLETRFPFVVVRDQKQDVAVEGCGAHLFGKRDFEALAGRLRSRLGGCGLGCGHAEKKDDAGQFSNVHSVVC